MAGCAGVMLGIPDEMISFEDDTSNGWIANKFGGIPHWMNKAPDVYPQCNLCGCHLPMIVQIYCPLENTSQYHRVLYVFGCANASCWNRKESWKILRCQSLVENTEPCKDVRQEVEKKESWCDEADDWGEEEAFQEANTITALKQLEEQTRNLNLNEVESPNYKPSLDTSNSHKTKPQIPAAPQFVPYYINVQEESHLLSEAATLTRSEKKLLDQYTAREGLPDIDEMMDGASGGGWGGEKYELGIAKHGDKIFQKFRKKLSLCPNQCLRYSWKGDPLLITSQGLGAIPSCISCGATRVFELQLMPALVSLLNIDGERHKITLPNNSKAKNENLESNNGHIVSQSAVFSNSEYIEFGTVFVYTCSQGCWTDGARYLEEYVIVHSDPDQHLFKSEK